MSFLMDTFPFQVQIFHIENSIFNNFSMFFPFSIAYFVLNAKGSSTRRI